MKFKKKKIVKAKKLVKKPKKVLLVKRKIASKKTKIQKKRITKKKNKKSIVKKIKKVIKRKSNKSNKKKSYTSKKPVRNKVKKTKKIKTLQENIDFSPKSFFKAKIKVIGIGGGGGSIVSEISRSLDKATFVIADTDTRAFGKQKGVKYFLFGQKETHGLGTGLNPQLAFDVAQKEKEKIASLFEDQDIVIFIASLGGGVGSGATKVFAEVSKNFNGIALGIFTLPFKFEGKNKYKIAYHALAELKNSLNVSITIPNENIFKFIDLNTPITDAFSLVNKKLAGSLESLIDLIYNPGIINIDFADVKSILKGKGNLAFLNTVEASGRDRSEKIVNEILHNPLYQNNNFIPEKVLFNILGGNNLSMFEVNKISSKISEENKKAKIIFGISKNSKYKNKIKATLLMTGASKVPDSTVVKASVVKPINIADNVKDKVTLKENKKTKKIVKKASKKYKKKSSSVQPPDDSKKIPFENALMPVFNDTPTDMGLHRLSVVESLGPENSVLRETLTVNQKPKKNIRRSALEIKAAQEMEENEKSTQEKEWEIPTFLRLKK